MMNFNLVCSYFVLVEDYFPLFSIIESQYRQIASTETGSIAGFLYLPNFHTVLNVLKDYFNSCSHVSIIFCGKIQFTFFCLL
jgi:hypothetical protein